MFIHAETESEMDVGESDHPKERRQPESAQLSWNDDSDAEKVQPSSSHECEESTAWLSANYCNRHKSLWLKDPEYFPREVVQIPLTKADRDDPRVIQWLVGSQAQCNNQEKWWARKI